VRLFKKVYEDTWFLDEVFIRIGGELHYLWRAVDQDGDCLNILVQKRRDKNILPDSIFSD